MDQPDLFDLERLANGVRARADGRGDGWANAHREQLWPDAYMQDLDGYFGLLTFAGNAGDRLFLEYVPDRDRAPDQAREFAVVAVFDRKRSRHAAFAPRSALSRGFYAWLCRVIGTRQPVRPRFFYVTGAERPPWILHEVDVETEEPTGAPALIRSTETDWKSVWCGVGLRDARDVLARWLRA